VLYHGPVRVPDDARAGTAILRFTLPDSSGQTSSPTDIEVKLVAPDARRAIDSRD
jgi:hypothetical protein